MPEGMPPHPANSRPLACRNQLCCLDSSWPKWLSGHWIAEEPVCCLGKRRKTLLVLEQSLSKILVQRHSPARVFRFDLVNHSGHVRPLDEYLQVLPVEITPLQTRYFTHP